MPYQFSPSSTPTAATAEVSVLIRITTDAGQAPDLAARVVEAVRTAAGGNPLTVSIPTAPTVPAPRRPLGSRLRINVADRRVEHEGALVDLTRLEFDLLLFLCRRPNRVHLRTTLLAEIWGLPEEVHTRTLDVHVRRIRRKLGSAAAMLDTVRGVGYRITGTEGLSIDEAA
ncbi:hypothetical protein GCM10010174_24730 [Kutzneria viridogrisea]|uniref:DNA-binding response OmpR family regulator n=1 Tax=Kutzneria viridogrisea TaxID=47990 RepID=A0ABR6BPV0_9PSEU|nr:DNA-binding response OmpR family regulator [Kutzneria viridogrisea]